MTYVIDFGDMEGRVITYGPFEDGLVAHMQLSKLIERQTDFYWRRRGMSRMAMNKTIHPDKRADHLDNFYSVYELDEFDGRWYVLYDPNGKMEAVSIMIPMSWWDKNDNGYDVRHEPIDFSLLKPIEDAFHEWDEAMDKREGKR